jgi:signal transduction histidine kinase
MPSPAALALDAGLLEVAHELRALSEDLRPPALSPFGLGAALHDLAERLEERHPRLTVRVDAPDTAGPVLPETPRLLLFRIAQEALHNAAQHAQAQTLDVRFALGDDAITLTVADDGRGFEPPADWNALAEDGHYGLVGIAERVASLGGTLTLDAAPGAGTRLHVSAPRDAG